MTNAIRTRIAPSPTGNLHVGTARTALYNELFARKNAGSFIVRSEDTDPSRSKNHFEQNILEYLKWLGITWDEGPDIGGKFGPYRQSERIQFYQTALEKLLADGKAYFDGPAIKLKVTQEDVLYNDLIRGPIKTATKTWGGDFVIARSMESPVFHLAVVVDDAAMQISHVIRGEDHIANTARHILLQQALDLPTPQYAHLPLLLDAQRRKLSKRANDVAVQQYAEGGYLPEALLNFLALLGWSPGNDLEIFTHEDMVKLFTLDRVQKGGAVFSEEKLIAVNKNYIRKMPIPELFELTRPYLENAKYDLTNKPYWQAALMTEQGRASTLTSFATALEFYQPDWPGNYAAELLLWRQNTPEKTKQMLKKSLDFLSLLPTADYNDEVLTKSMLQWIEASKLDKGDILWPLRVALTGQKNSPSPFEVAAVLGKETARQRINHALEKL